MNFWVRWPKEKLQARYGILSPLLSIFLSLIRLPFNGVTIRFSINLL
jgi:hypothetical protein